MGASEAKIVDHRDSALAERQRCNFDYTARFDDKRSQIGWEGNDGNVLFAAPSSFGQFVRIGDGAESAPNLIRAPDRFNVQIVPEDHIQLIVLEQVEDDV